MIFGANGDLTKRLLMPALYNLSGSKLLDDRFSILGVDRDASTDDAFQGRQQTDDGKLHARRRRRVRREDAERRLVGLAASRLHYMQPATSPRTRRSTP